MNIQRIGVNTSLGRKSGVKSAKTVSKPNFKGNYFAAYNSGLKQSLNNYNEAIALYRKLATAAKTEDGLFKGIFFKLLGGDVRNALKEARSCSYHTGDLLTSTSHESPLVTMNNGEISFHHPKYGTFGQGNISFWLSDNNDLCVSRPSDYFKFYEYGGIKETYKNYEDGGGIYNHYYYNRDGSKSVLKNLFFGDL